MTKYHAYEAAKQALIRKNLPSVEYWRELQKIAKRLGV